MAALLSSGTGAVSVAHAIPGRVRLRLPRIGRDEAFGPLLEAGLAAVPGVLSVRIAEGASSAVVEHDPRIIDVGAIVRAAAEASAAPAPRGALRAARGARKARRASAMAKRPLYLSSAGVLFSLGFVSPLLAYPFIAATCAPIFKRAWDSVARQRKLNVDLLDSLAIASAVATGDAVNAAGIIWLVTLGDHIRDLTQARARRAIRGLLGYQQDLAWVVRGDAKVQVPVAELAVGDVLVVYTGSVIPVDGTVTDGDGLVDQQTLTGESMPVLKGPGDRCFAATVIKDGKLYIRAERVGGDTTAASTARLIENAPALETRAQNYAEVVADRLVPPALACSGVVLAATRDLGRVSAILTIDFGTGPRVSAPTTVLASMNAAARRGILIKGGAYIEKLARVSTVVFDKTGTLTSGVPEVTDFLVHDALSEREAATLAAAVSARQTHPVSQAVLRLADAWQLSIPDREESRYLVGRGVQARVFGKVVQLGSPRFIEELGVSCRAEAGARQALEATAKSLLFLAVDGRHVATLAYRDAIRAESRATIRSLRERGIDDIVMLTGDSREVARQVSLELGITRYFAEMLPEDKAEITRRLTQEGRTVAVVGDGINDSPALSYADIGISVSAGAEIARETAGVVLVEDDLSKLVEAIDISRGAMRIIHQNFSMMLAVNAVAYALSIPGLLNPVAATLMNNGSAVLACVNGLRPLMAARARRR
ncbi:MULTISPECIES: heavy metal translocating P-type ATPase [Sorangium]|uniref:P-type Zn(2+) transporter n=1 Tax=Sorangium cellulosum TaxID=56 RepID=A0A4P2QJU2_SORCE|nr:MULTISPECIES: heavy metal translocating P-type ATPase [Sorangium]AUX29703.1 cation transporter [Sorangium cellulosum]WCQ89092.1 Manganese-exporting P-type ATPase [Sorangium sp. Soce836]